MHVMHNNKNTDVQKSMYEKANSISESASTCDSKVLNLKTYKIEHVLEHFATQNGENRMNGRRRLANLQKYNFNSWHLCKKSEQIV
jgi:hypothetical protein